MLALVSFLLDRDYNATGYECLSKERHGSSWFRQLFGTGSGLDWIRYHRLLRVKSGGEDFVIISRRSSNPKTV